MMSIDPPSPKCSFFARSRHSPNVAKPRVLDSKYEGPSSENNPDGPLLCPQKITAYLLARQLVIPHSKKWSRTPGSIETDSAKDVSTPLAHLNVPGRFR